jgi:hypothetical protein
MNEAPKQQVESRGKREDSRLVVASGGGSRHPDRHQSTSAREYPVIRLAPR